MTLLEFCELFFTVVILMCCLWSIYDITSEAYSYLYKKYIKKEKSDLFEEFFDKIIVFNDFYITNPDEAVFDNKRHVITEKTMFKFREDGRDIVLHLNKCSKNSRQKFFYVLYEKLQKINTEEYNGKFFINLEKRNTARDKVCFMIPQMRRLFP